MDPSSLLERLQRVSLPGAVCLAAVVFWPGGVDVFGLPKATAVVLCALLAGGAELARWAFERRVEVPIGPAVAALCLFVVGLFVATLTSPVPAISVVGEFARYSGLIGYLSCATLFLLAARQATGASTVALLKAVVGALYAVGGYAAVQLLGADPYAWTSTFEKVFSSLGNANFLAGWCAIAGVLALGLATDPGVPPPWRRTAAASAVVAAVAVVGSRSAQGPIALAIGVLVLAVVEPSIRDAAGRSMARWLPNAGRGVRLGAAVTLLLVVFGLALPLAPRVLDGLNPRDDYWRAGLEMIKDEPLVGVGLDAYGQHFLAYRSASHAELFDFEIAEAAHDVPLQLFATGGILLGAGYLAFVLLTGSALVRGLGATTGAQRRALGTVGAAWVTYQVQSLVSIDVPSLAVLHFVLAGTIVALAGAAPVKRFGLPGRPARAHRRRRGTTSTVVPMPSRVVAGLVAALVVVTAWQVARPLRADVAAAAASEAIERGDLPQALADAQKASALAPWRADHWFLQTAALERMGRIDDALAATEEAARREPGNSLLALFAGRLARAVPDDAAARRWYRAAVRRDPRHVEVLAEAAAAALARGDDQDARAFIEQAGEVTDTDELGALQELGRALDASGREEDAREIWRVVLDKDAGDPIARARLGLPVPEEG